MDYKEKYEHALERAREIIKDYENRGLKDNLFYANEDFEAIFPELKESEDERIRKWLIDWAKAVNWSEQFTITKEHVLAWLEKQGEKSINQYDIEIPFGAKDSELIEESYYIPKGYHAEISKDKVTIKKGEQEPTWSEKDEAGLCDALWAIKQAKKIAKDENDMGNLWYAEDWLKSLKQRIGG